MSSLLSLQRRVRPQLVRTLPAAVRIVPSRSLLLNGRTGNRGLVHTPLSRAAARVVAQQTRTISFMGAPRYLFQAVRLPVTLFGVGAGAAGYANYKLHELSDKVIPGWLPELVTDVKGAFQSIRGADWQLPSFGASTGDADRDVYRAERVRYDHGSDQHKQSPPPPPQQPEDNTAAAVAAAAAVALGTDAMSQTNRRSDADSAERNDALMELTRTLIEIRNILKTIKHDGTLQLPSIVVIGSQSSGKSSVLEAIVGQEFLPKGSNMVTRRPIELTLIHTPDSKEEYGEFPQLGLGKLSDFSRVRQTLTDLNMAVPAEECISPEPIELRIYSPNVPDLTLVDLPGYIQVHNRNQPELLKQKIASLCDIYIREPNIILAVCAADVDLANSEALLASRRADPLGVRTIGVLTKMDLVEPTAGVDLLRNSDYPLLLGYVGVVSKQRKARPGSKAVIPSGDAYFSAHSEYTQRDLQVGTSYLKTKLIKVLEENMRRSLHSIVDAVQTELDETRYQYKVHYNDRPISPESYAADSLDALKQAFKQFSTQFNRAEVRASVKGMLEQRALDICARLYWNDRRLADLPKASSDDLYWQRKLDLGVSSLTKCGVGRLSTQLVMDVLKHNLEQIVKIEPFPHHPGTQRTVSTFANDILRRKFHFAMDQVENTIKPFKFEVDCTQQEWEASVERATRLVEREMDMCARALRDANTRIGKRTLNTAIRYLEETAAHTTPKRIENNVFRATSAAPLPNAANNGSATATNASAAENDDAAAAPQPLLNPAVLDEARQAMALRDRLAILKLRHTALRSKQCRDKRRRIHCPEAFLEVVADKLTNTAVMFLQVELLNEFFFQFPREVDSRLYFGLDKQHVLAFAKENPRIEQQLELMSRKRKLEDVMDKLGYVMRQQERLAV